MKAAKWIIAYIGGPSLALAVVGVLIWLLIAELQRKDAPVEVSVPATPAKEVAKAPTKKVTPKAPLTVYTGDTKAKLKLPDEVVKDQNKQVLQATQVRASDRPQTITTTVDTETGETKSYVRQDPYPWFAIETRGEARIAAGYKLRSGDIMPKPIVRLGIGYDVIRVKALTAGVTGTIDSDGDAFLGVGVAYRF